MQEETKLGIVVFVGVWLLCGLVGIVASWDVWGASNTKTDALQALQWTGAQWTIWAVICTMIAALVGLVVWASERF